MKKGILGRKIGMTSVFTESGKQVPVTVIEVTPNVITQIKTLENDGYEAIQLGFLDKKEKNTSKGSIGHTKKANTTPKRFFREIRGVEVSNYSLGQEINADTFAVGEVVDVTGTSKGKGFQGVIKRHNQNRGPMGHGSQYHRGVGSMGTMRPMRVFKGKNLPGHMGGETVTIQNLEVIDVDTENNLILIKGNVPGPKKSLVIIKTSVKKNDVVKDAEKLISYETEEVVNNTSEENIEEISTEETNSQE